MTPIVLATDGSEFSLKAARFLNDNKVVPADGVVHVVHVAAQLTGRAAMYIDSEAVSQWQEAESNEAINPVLDLLQQMGIPAERKALTGNAANEIPRYAEEVGAHLIVLGAHGRGRLANALLGSVTNRVLQRAHCSVLVVK